jgi:DNA polymerase III sliding clamp (beta) subunit (PCNA family)
MVAAIDRVKRAAASTTTMPILQHLYVAAAVGDLGEPATVTLACTDVEVRLMTVVRDGVEVTEAGSLTTPLRVIDEAVDLADDAVVHFEREAGDLRMRAGKARFRLLALPGEDYPSWVENEEDAVTFGCEADAARAAVAFASIGIGNTKQVHLRGLMTFVSGASVYVCATDTHQLAEGKFPAEDVVGGDSGVMLPERAMRELSRLPGERWAWRFGRGMATVVGADVTLSARLMTNVPYRHDQLSALFDKAAPEDLVAAIDSAVFVKSLRRAALVMSDALGQRVTMTVDGGDLEVKSSDSTGDFDERIPAQVAEGRDGHTFDVNAALLLTAVTATGGQVQVWQHGPMTPVRIQTDLPYRYALMPMTRV